MEQITLEVQGMTCGGCAGGVQRKLMSLDGVKSATVDHAQGRALVEYDANAVTPAQMVQVIEDAGFDAQA